MLHLRDLQDLFTNGREPVNNPSRPGLARAIAVAYALGVHVRADDGSVQRNVRENLVFVLTSRRETISEYLGTQGRHRK